MKNLLLPLIIVLFAGLTLKSQNAGEICLIGMNADNPDKILFVALVAVPGSTEIFFADEEWNGTGWNSGEGWMKYTAPAGGLSAGTVVELTYPSAASVGTFATDGGSFALSASGDQLYMYLGTDKDNPTTFLYALNTKNGWSGSELTNTGLTDGVNALTFANSTDNVRYDGTRNGTLAQLQAAIADVTNNWSTSSSPFTFDQTPFVIGTGLNSNESDITKTAGWSEPQNIDYSLYVTSSGLTTANAIEVASFTINDGGAGNDPDNEPTILTDVIFDVVNSGNIQAMAIFDGSTNISETTTIGTSVSFNSISGLSAPDDGAKDFSVYASFKSSVTDNENLRFTVASAIADITGSTFAQANAGGASTDNSGDNNKIVVTADRLAYTPNKPPTAVLTNTDFSVEVNAVDANDNVDEDASGNASLSLTTGSGSLSSITGLANQPLASGIFEWTDVQYDTQGDFTITASISGLTDVTSGTITASQGENTDLIISEVADPGSPALAKYIEIYNAGPTTVDFGSFTWYICRQTHGTSTWFDVQLTGSIAPGECYVVTSLQTEFENAYGYGLWDQLGAGMNGNGDDGYFLYKDGDHSGGTLIDAYGEINVDGTGTEWEYTNCHAVRNRNILTPITTWTKSEWTIVAADADDMTPDYHRQDRVWQGTSSTDWNEKGANWDDTGYIPDPSDNVTIPNGASNQPVITKDAACNDLSIASGMTLTQNADTYFTLVGSVTNNNGTDGIVLKSDASNTASFLNWSSTPEATVERYISDEMWHYISAPLSNAKSDVFYNLYLKSFEEADSTWTYIIPTDIDLNVMEGYATWASSALTGSATLEYKGMVNSGSKSINVTYHPAADHGSKGWNFVGNPYTTAIDWTSSGWTKTNITDDLRIWNPAIGNYGSFTNGVSQNDVDSIIPAQQGFFVNCNDAGGGTLGVTNDVRIHDEKAFFKGGNMIHQQCMKLSVSANGYYDETLIRINALATSEYDVGVDAMKWSGLIEAPQVFTINNTQERLSINAIPCVEKNSIIPVGFEISQTGTFTIVAEDIANIVGEGNLYLEDVHSGKVQNLKGDPSFDFEYVIGSPVHRFNLIFGEPSGANEFSLSEFDIRIHSNKIYIQNPANLSGQIVVNDMTGKTVISESLNQQDVQVISVDMSSGFYVISVISAEKTYSEKVIISSH